MQVLKTPSITKAKIAEVFHSVQGEGIYTGIPQVFVRFLGCNLNCSFCDTRLANSYEYSVLELFKKLCSFAEQFDSICFTGGEPLVQKDFLKEIAFLTKREGFATYLETNGLLLGELSELIDYIDIVAMDWKLSSSTGLADFSREHLEFLKIALKKEAFIKMVICNSTNDDEIERAIELISEIDRDIPLVLQPNHFELGINLTDKLKSYQQMCLGYLSDVRIMPQIHKILGVR